MTTCSPPTLFDTKPSQCQMIIAHLEQGKALTVAEALQIYGIYALSQRIGELKRRGIDIQSEMVERNGKRFAEYRLTLQGLETLNSGRP